MTGFQLVKSEILALIQSARLKLTPLQLQREILGRHPKLDPLSIRQLIRELVNEGDLAYSFQFGASYLEPSFEKPIRISKRLVLKPPALKYQPEPLDIVIGLEKGAAFGTGTHPTTRLALRGIEYACGSEEQTDARKHWRALDVGTGSGVLALAAAALGYGEVWGVDIDACALAEAGRNAQLNGFSGTIHLSDRIPSWPPGAIHLLMANLRTPSLLEMSTTLTHLTADQGRIVLSGIQLSEEDRIQGKMAALGMPCLWRSEEGGWLGMAFQRNAALYPGVEKPMLPH
jgi:ribosomal protein L11 methyltransferase